MPEEKNPPVRNYVGNSHRNKQEPEAVEVERVKLDTVIEGKVIKRKRGLWRKMSESFTGDDARSVGAYLVWDIAIPAFKDLIFDLIKTGAERSLFPDSRPSSRDRRPGSSRTAYDKKFMGRDRDEPRDRREVVSSHARRTHNFDDIVLDTRADVERVLDGLTALIEKYEVATLYDLYDLLGTTGDFVDYKWGWINLSTARAVRVREGWLLDLPAPEEIS